MCHQPSLSEQLSAPPSGVSEPLTLVGGSFYVPWEALRESSLHSAEPNLERLGSELKRMANALQQQFIQVWHGKDARDLFSLSP